MKKLGIGAGICLLSSSIASFAGTMGPIASDVSESGFFIGLGGSYNSVNLSQKLFAAGTSNVFSGATLVAFGEAGGPAIPYNRTHSTFAPDAQAGYFGHFGGSDLLWGVKYLYKYLNNNFSESNIAVPQYGSFTNTGSAPANTTFTGNVVIQSSQTSVNHEMALLAFVGQSFTKGHIYLGAGPSLFGAQSNIYNAVGYADINGVHTDITGTSSNFANTNWVWGGAAQIGVTYDVSPTWFLDVNYTYAITGNYTNKNSGPFANATDGYTDTGTLYVNGTQRIISQGVSVTINKVFSL